MSRFGAITNPNCGITFISGISTVGTRTKSKSGLNQSFIICIIFIILFIYGGKLTNPVRFFARELQ
jgi:hypothetical protein